MNAYARLTDSEWLQTLVASLADRSLGLPGFPPDTIQSNFTGRSGRATLEEAFEFYRLVKGSVAKLERPVLDFGIGWGRIMRFFIKDMPCDQLYGVDVEPSAIEECRRAAMPGNIKQIDPHGCLPFDNRMFQIVYAYSVFTHLPPASAEHWMAEIKRVLHPCGKIVFTALSARYLELCATYQAYPEGTWQRRLSSQFPNPRERIADYEAGVHVYSPISGGMTLSDDIYGWAAVPPSVMQTKWGLKLDHIDDSGDLFLQTAIVASAL